MKNLSANLNLKDLRHFKFDVRYLFLAILLVVLVMDGLVAKDAIDMVIKLENQIAPVSAAGPGARINFSDYDYDVQRIQSGQNFQPSGGLTRDPFNPAAAPAPAGATPQ